MRRKKEQDNKPYNFDDEKEFAIYKNMCKQKVKFGEKELIEGHKFSTYDEWKAYAMEKYLYVSLKSLYDVKRFLQRRRRSGNTMLDAYKSLLIPWILAILTYILSSNMDLTMINEYGIIAKIMLIAFRCTVIIVITTVLFKKLISNFGTQNLENLMYDDYVEIIEGMIEDRKRQEASEDESTS